MPAATASNAPTLGTPAQDPTEPAARPVNAVIWALFAATVTLFPVGWLPVGHFQLETFALVTFATYVAERYPLAEIVGSHGYRFTMTWTVVFATVTLAPGSWVGAAVALGAMLAELQEHALGRGRPGWAAAPSIADLTTMAAVAGGIAAHDNLSLDGLLTGALQARWQLIAALGAVVILKTLPWVVDLVRRRPVVTELVDADLPAWHPAAWIALNIVAGGFVGFLIGVFVLDRRIWALLLLLGLIAAFLAIWTDQAERAVRSTLRLHVMRALWKQVVVLDGDTTINRSVRMLMVMSELSRSPARMAYLDGERSRLYINDAAGSLPRTAALGPEVAELSWVVQALESTDRVQTRTNESPADPFPQSLLVRMGFGLGHRIVVNVERPDNATRDRSLQKVLSMMSVSSDDYLGLDAAATGSCDDVAQRVKQATTQLHELIATGNHIPVEAVLRQLDEVNELVTRALGARSPETESSARVSPAVALGAVWRP